MSARLEKKSMKRGKRKVAPIGGAAKVRHVPGVRLSSPFGKELIRHPALKSALTLVERHSTRVEQKGKTPALVFDEETMSVARGLLSAKAEYAFRVWSNATMAISSNAVVAAITLSPTATSEWTSIAALFDEYRVDAVYCHLCPIMVAGTNSMNWASGGYAIANDYNSSQTPTTYNEVLEHAESHLEPLSSIFAIGVTSTNATSQGSKKLVWCAVPPKLVELGTAATVAQAEWVETAVAWPGSIQFIATVNGDNAATPIQRYVEYHVRCRQRR